LIDRADATSITLNLRDIPALLVIPTSRATHHACGAVCSACRRCPDHFRGLAPLAASIAGVRTGDLHKLMTLSVPPPVREYPGKLRKIRQALRPNGAPPNFENRISMPFDKSQVQNVLNVLNVRNALNKKNKKHEEIPQFARAAKSATCRGRAWWTRERAGILGENSLLPFQGVKRMNSLIQRTRADCRRPPLDERPSPNCAYAK